MSEVGKVNSTQSEVPQKAQSEVKVETGKNDFEIAEALTGKKGEVLETLKDLSVLGVAGGMVMGKKIVDELKETSLEEKKEKIVDTLKKASVFGVAGGMVMGKKIVDKLMPDGFHPIEGMKARLEKDFENFKEGKSGTGTDNAYLAEIKASCGENSDVYKLALAGAEKVDEIKAEFIEGTNKIAENQGESAFNPMASSRDAAIEYAKKHKAE